jgi:LL-diaminopimelate aminotransferase
MKINTSKIANSFQTGIFSELAKSKREKLAQGMDIIDLSVGSPDLPPPPFVMEELAKHILDPTQYGYTLGGSDEFHDAVAHYYQHRFQVQLNANKEVLLLMGSQDGLVHLPMTFANPGDLILVPDPGYTAYEAGVNLAGAKLYPMPLRNENGFLPNLQEIPEEIAHQAKIMILNFPGNPVPVLADRSFFEEIVNFARMYNILVVHDFAYSELVFDGKRPISFLEIEGAKEVGVEFNSLSKSFNMAGCRIGYLAGHPEIVEILGRVKSNLDYGVFSPVQKAASLALTSGRQFLDDLAKVYERRRNVLVDGLTSLGWAIERPSATMFIWAEIPKGWTSREFTFQLLNKAGVVVTPGNAFGEHGEGYVRIGLVQSEANLQKAVERIQQSGILG